MNNELITRQQSAAMRGIAILAIILHNYCHWLPMVQENEYTYTQSNADQIWLKIINPGMDIIAQLFSFFGHYGVPVFVFLSAYGLVMKYEVPQPPKGESLKNGLNSKDSDNTILKNSPLGGWGTVGGAVTFIWQHYKKLFLMMIVGYVAFVMVDYMTPGHRHYEFWNVIGQLGMFSNFYADPDHDIWPGPYWYFGLMVQIYIVYRLILYKGKGSLGGLLPNWGYNVMVAVLFFGTLLGQCAFGHESMQLQWYRYNVMGSLPVFIAGLEYARKADASKDYRWGYIVSFIISLGLLLCGDTFIIWLILPFVVVSATVSLINFLPQCILKPLAWVGSISAAMFVCHPITRKVLIPISRGGDLYTGLILYLVATLILAILFKHLIAIVSGKK